MAIVHKIKELVFEETFVLIGIRSNLSDYSLVYAINQVLKARLVRSKMDWQLEPELNFGHYIWDDEINDRSWDFFKNNCMHEVALSNTDLFHGQSSITRHHLVPEHKDADYLLKIEDDQLDQNETIKILASLQGVQAAYGIDTQRLKSVKNLIY